MKYLMTVRYGGARQRYHTFEVDASDLAQALAQAASSLPPEVLETADLLEARVAVDPDARSYEGAG